MKQIVQNYKSGEIILTDISIPMLLKLFHKFENVRTEVWFFNKYHWGPLSKMIPEKFAKFLGKRWGWHRVVYGLKS